MGKTRKRVLVVSDTRLHVLAEGLMYESIGYTFCEDDNYNSLLIPLTHQDILDGNADVVLRALSLISKVKDKTLIVVDTTGLSEVHDMLDISNEIHKLFGTDVMSLVYDSKMTPTYKLVSGIAYAFEDEERSTYSFIQLRGIIVSILDGKLTIYDRV